MVASLQKEICKVELSRNTVALQYVIKMSRSVGTSKALKFGEDVMGSFDGSYRGRFTNNDRLVCVLLRVFFNNTNKTLPMV